MGDQSISTWAPLPNDTSIRLLRIHDLTPDKPYKLFVEVEVVDLSNILVAEDEDHSDERDQAADADHVTYTALSYTWGSPICSQSWIDEYDTNNDVAIGVLANGDSMKSMSIGKNLFEALQETSRLDSIGLIWIDAICIDQSNLDEKNKQVALMTQIYSKASLVLIWPGRDDQENPLADVAWFHTVVVNHVKEYEENNGVLEPGNIGYLETVGMNIAGLTVSPGVMRSLYSFYAQRRYFNRTWVMQEVSLAKETVVLLNQQIISLRVFADVQAWLRSKQWTKMLVSRSSKELVGDGNELFETWRGINLKGLFEDRGSLIYELLEQLYDARSDEARYSAIWLLYIGSGNQQRYSTDPRDMVFSLCGLVSYNATRHGTVPSPIKPDYHKTVAEVYTDFTVSLIEGMSNLSVLSLFSTDRIPGLPSWVPNYSTCGTYKPIFPGFYALWQTYPSFGPQVEPELPVFRISGNELHLSGYKIQSVERCFTIFAESPPDVGKPTKYLSMLCQVMRFCLTLPLLYPTGESSIEALFRVLTYSSSKDDGMSSDDFAERVQNCVYTLLTDMEFVTDEREHWQPLSNEIVSSFGRLNEHACVPSEESARLLLRQASSTASFVRKLQEDIDDSQLLDDFESSPELVEFNAYRDKMNAMESCTTYIRCDPSENTVVFVTQDKYVGRTTGFVRPDDELWLLQGAKVPLLLRPNSNGRYNLIAEAFVHGTMYWELEKKHTALQNIVVV